MDPAVLDRVEKQRQTLEENVAKLRKSLRHWQALELDYEGLREEFQLLPETASSEDCMRAATEFQAVVVTEKDLKDLLGAQKPGKRSPQQLAGLLSKRVEYVSRNADTVRKQISAEEKKLNALLLAEDPQHRDEAGLPLTEITEELDDSGNILSTKIERPGEGVADLANVLEKAGVEGLSTKDGKLSVATQPISTDATIATTSKASTELLNDSLDFSPVEDDVSDVDEEMPRKDGPVRVPIPGGNPIPVHIRDTEEEAKLRREMLEYGLNEVGAIVAELDLQEDASDVSYDEDDDDAGLMVDSDFEDDDDEEASEDEFGRVKKPAISEKYKQKMEELQKKHGLTDLTNLGPSPDLPDGLQEAIDRPTAAEAARNAALARAESAAKEPLPIRPKAKKSDKSKKSVAFSDNLDIAKEKSPVPEPMQPQNAIVQPVGETVVERSDIIETGAPPPPPSAPTSRKSPSRFKAARDAAAKSSTTAPLTSTALKPLNPTSNKTTASQPSSLTATKDRPLVAPQVLERPITTLPSAPSTADIDDEMHRRQIAMEYHRIQNRRVHEQGGFVRGDQIGRAHV